MENINLRLRQNDPNAPQVDEAEVNNNNNDQQWPPDRKAVDEIWTLVDDFEDQIKVLKELTGKNLTNHKDKMWGKLDDAYTKHR